MWDSYLLKLIEIFILLNLSAFFSGSETAFFSLNRVILNRLKKEKNLSSMLILKLLENKEGFLTTILLGNEIVNVSISALSASFSMTLLGNEAVSYMVFVITFIILIYGEIVPKLIAVRFNILWARIACFPLYLFFVVSSPFRFILELVAEKVSSIFKEETAFKEEEIKALISEAHLKGEIEDKEKKMIYNIFKFTDITVKEIMTPEPDMLAVPVNIEIDTLKSLLKENPHSKIPVYEGDKDNIIGYIHIKDLLPVLKGLSNQTLKDLLRECPFVPETKAIYEMLKEFQYKKIDIAIVINEYGGVEGLVTLEDILEEIVGEIRDEFDKESPIFEKIEENRFLIDARIPLEEVVELLKLELPEEPDVETFGGFLFHLFGKIPEKNETVEYKGWRFKVIETRKRRIIKVMAEKLQ